MLFEKLALEGMKMTQFYMSAGICTPSRASMLTGRQPVRSGTYTALLPPNDEYFRVFYPSSEGCMDVNEITIASGLSDIGYKTGLIGKWHLGHRIDIGCLPGEGRRGFDYFFGLPYSHEEGYPGPFPEGLIWPPVPLYENSTFVEQPFNATDITSRYTANSIDFINEADAANQPYFLHVAYENPHVPLFTSPEFEGVSRRGFYGDSVEEMDASVGEIMSVVRSSTKSTFVIFTSDNGAWVNANSGLSNNAINSRSGIGTYDGGSNGMLFEGKGSTYEGGVRVPCIFWWPDHISPGVTSLATTSALDFLPTFLNLASAPLPDVVLDGKDMSSVLFEQDDYGPWYGDYLFFWRESQVYAVRNGRYKLHYITRSGFNISDLGTAHDPPLIFDVESDASEKYPIDCANNTDDGSSSCPSEMLTLINNTNQALNNHLASIGNPMPTPQYGPQNWTVVPCCPRGSFNPADAIAYAQAGEWGLAIWDQCVCAREDE